MKVNVIELVGPYSPSWDTDGKNCKMLNDTSVIFSIDNGNKEKVIIKKGFVTDRDSIPEPVKKLFNLDGSDEWAAVIHDWFYRVDMERGKKFADKIFLSAMKKLKVRLTLRYSIYFGVVLLGKKSWNENFKKLKENG